MHDDKAVVACLQRFLTRQVEMTEGADTNEQPSRASSGTAGEGPTAPKTQHVSRVPGCDKSNVPHTPRATSSTRRGEQDEVIIMSRTVAKIVSSRPGR